MSVLGVACFGGALSAQAETFPPGHYYMEGRVVRRANGDMGLFWGTACFEMPEKARRQLEPYLGKFVNVGYERVNGRSFEGSVFGEIDQINPIADSPEALPLRIEIKAAKAEVAMNEPIVVRVSVTNPHDRPQTIGFNSGATVLCQDYREKFRLETEGHYNEDKPYGLSRGRAFALNPGETLQYEIVSNSMAEPGEYQLLHFLPCAAGEYYQQSEIAKVVVLEPKDEQERLAALRSWLYRASPGQRIKIAERLLASGDRSGIDEVLRLLRAGEYSKPFYCNSSAFQFGFQAGGTEGEKVMMELIKNQKGQESALRMIESIYLSPRRVELLRELLACKGAVMRGIYGWVDEPRICDIAADWLAGYTDYKIRFPENGSLAERDAGVALVRRQLEETPEAFEVLTRPLP